MSISERKLKYNLNLAKYYFINRNTDITFKDKAISIIKDCYHPFETNLVSTLANTSSDSIVDLAEVAFTVSLPSISEHLINIFFELDSSRILSKNAYYVRALLIKAMVDAKVVDTEKLKAEEAVSKLSIAVKSIQRGIEIIAKPENKAKYASLLYNASVITINILKNYLKINWSKNFWEILEKLSQMIEENDDVDINWRIFLLIKLAQAYIDADKKAEAGKAIDKIGDILKKKGDCDFMDELYRIRIHLSRDNNGALGNLKKEGESNANYPQLKYIYTVQAIKSNIITEKDIEKEVTTVITALCPDFYKNIDQSTGKYKSEVSIKIDSWKADVLSELAYSVMKYKSMLNTSFNIYYFLFQNGSNSLKGKIFLENIKSQKLLYDLESELKTNVQSVDVIRQKRIDAIKESLNVLERNMTGCARLQDYDLINETAMLIFNTAMPFFKKSFRKYFYKAFYTSCDQLEQISSNENLLRAALHYELAKYYIEEDLLQEANTNLIKALSNDYSIPLAKLGGNAASTNKKNAKDANANANSEISLTNSLTNNVSYLQRYLEQHLVYLKRFIGVKINIYSDPDNTIDKLIFECDNIKNSKNIAVQKETINKCLELINSFTFDEFKLPESEREFVEEEVNEFKMKHDLKLYDDKKHFINICMDIAELCYTCDLYEGIFAIDKAVSKFTDELSNTKDIDQLISISDIKRQCALAYAEYLLQECLEPCSNDYVNFEDATRQYTDVEKSKFDEWRNGIYASLKEAIRLAVLTNQHWLIFSIGQTIWNMILPLVKSPKFLSSCNEAMLPILNDLFDAMNNAMIYYESINAEVSDTDYYQKLSEFVHIAAKFGELLESKQKQEECLKVCDTMLSRKMESKYRKIFDTLKARALKINDTGAATGKKKPPAKAPVSKKDNTGSTFVPSQDMTLISECFTNIENAINTSDEKSKIEMLKKGIDMLKTYKVNFNDENTLELNSELWYKHGVNFFAINTNECYKYALLCANNCVKTYDNIDIKKKNISLQLQKWYCLGFLLYGDCLLKLVDGEKQERLSQIKLYFQAIDKILISAKIAEKAKQYYVILQAMKAFYTIVINVIDQPQNREQLCPKFLALHQILMNNKAGATILYSDTEFLLLFFSLFCHCINETKNWAMGEKIISEAIKIIPNNFQHFLLEHKLFYYSKQGKSFLQNINANPSSSNQGSGGDKDVLTKAKLFTKLARSSTNKADQFNAYNKAIELLKNDQNIYVCNVIFELSSWLYKNNYPFADVEENLNNAADILLEIEAIFEDDEDLEEEGKTLHSKRSTSSRKSRLSKRSRSKKSGVSGSKRRSSVTGGKSKASERTKSRNYSTHTSKTKTIFAKMLDYDPYPLYMNINHFEHLFKIQVFLSIVSNDYIKKQEYLLDAFFILKKIIEISMKTMNCIEFYEKNKDDIITNNFDGTDVNPLMSLVSNYYIAKDMNIPQTYTVPETLDGWLTYNWPEKFLNKIQSENDANANQAATITNSNNSLPNYTFFCKKSFETPYQFFYYFNYMLDKFMNEYYYHSESLMMIKFGMLYSKYIINNSEMEYAYKLKYSRLVNNIVINSPENKVSVDIFNELNSSLESPPTLTNEIIQKRRDELRKFDLKLNNNNEDSFMPLSAEHIDAVIKYVDDLLPHICWIELAKEYYQCGYYNYSKEYCKESLFHSLVLKDKDSFITTNLLIANISFIEANFEQSSSLFAKIQNINQSPLHMFSVIKDMTFIFDYMHKYEEMEMFLGSVIDYLGEEYEKKVKPELYKGSLSIFYQIYTFAMINKTRAMIKQYSENLRANEYNIIKEQRGNMSAILTFFKSEVLPNIKNFNELTAKSSFNVYNIQSLFDFISLALLCLTKNNIFVYVTKEELGVISEILEKCLTILEDITGYLNHLQTYIPLRIDNSLISLPVHRMLGYCKIVYASINNIIGEFKSRIKRESAKSEKLSLNDKDIKNKFAEGVKYNQDVIDYLNSLTKKINKMNTLDKRDNIENMNRYEKSISLLVSCESLIPKVSNEYVLYFIEKINSFRLQALHYKELKHLWKKETLDEIKALLNPPSMEDIANETQKTQSKKDEKTKSVLQIQKFHQSTINLISEFEANIISNEQYDTIIKANSYQLMKYYFSIIETTGYLNIELAFKGLIDYQNSNIKSYFNEVIDRYVNPQSRDWSSFALLHQSEKSFSFDCAYPKVYQSASIPKSIENFEKYVKDIPYYKNANSSFYSSWSEVKGLLPNNSACFVMEMTEDKSILYIGLMTLTGGAERKINYLLKRIVLDTNINGKIDEMIQKIKVLKHTLIKTVIVTKEEMTRMFQEQNDVITKIIYDMENDLPELKEAFDEINEIINPNLELLEQQEKEKEAANAKGKKQSAPAKKNDKNAIASDIPLPTSNIEQIVFLIDTRLSDLPFESLSVFSKIPFKSIDFSMNTFIMRLKTVAFNPATANTVSLPGNVKYYLDYSSEQNFKFDLKNSVTSHLSSQTGGKNNPVSPIEGVLSSEHKPSIAELQKLYMNSNLFIFTSQTALLYQFPFELFDTSRYSKCRIGIVFDRICNTKNYVDQNSLIPKTFSFNYQPLDTIAMMTICGVATTVTTKWSLDYDEISELMEDMLDEATTKALCVSYAMNKYKEPKREMIKKEEEERLPSAKDGKGKPPSSKGKKETKKKEENVVLDDTNSIEIKKLNVYKLAPVVYGLNNVKLV